jgi:hypothetical protein
MIKFRVFAMRSALVVLILTGAVAVSSAQRNAERPAGLRIVVIEG